MNFKDAFHKAYLLQQGITEVTEEAVLDYSVEPDRLVLVEETADYWIIRVLPFDRAGESLSVVYKHTFEMETIEIGFVQDEG